VKVGQTIITVLDGSGTSHTLAAPFAGQALTLGVSPGQPVTVGEPVLSLEAAPSTPSATGPTLHAVLFVPSSKVSSIGPGMPVQMSLNSAPSAAFGLLRGKVTSIQPFPVTSGQALALLGNQLLVNKLVGNQVVQLVTVTLTADHTKSGYAWTTANGPPFPLTPQSLLSATVRIGNEHPINLVFGK
jgi:hypothetical protein